MAFSRVRRFALSLAVGLLTVQPHPLWASQPVDTAGAAPAAVAPDAQAPKKHFLWKFEANGGRIYLLGSIHVLNESVYPLPEVMEKAFRESDALVVELDPMEGGAEVQQALLAEALYMDGTTLADHIKPADLTAFKQGLKEFALDFSEFQSFKPWFVSLLVTLAVVQQMGFDPAYGIDMHFLEQAKQNGKPIIALETIETQVKALSSLSDVDQGLLLRYTVKDLGLLKETFSQMIQLWRSGDAEGLHALFSEPSKEWPEFKKIEKVVIDDRNTDMAAKIEGLLRGGKRCFVVIGSAHLTGEKGIVALLRKRGYAPQQL